MNKVENKLQVVYDFTVNYIENNGFPPSVREICSKCGIKSTASAYVYLERLKERGLLLKSPSKNRAISVPSFNKEFPKIPLIGTVTAGTPIFDVENLDGYIPLPSEFENEKDCFALRISGESMINVGILDGDMIVAEKTCYAENGEIVVALIDNEATVKRFFRESGHYRLQPENDTMEPIIVDEVLILGKVVAIQRSYI